MSSYLSLPAFHDQQLQFLSYSPLELVQNTLRRLLKREMVSGPELVDVGLAELTKAKPVLTLCADAEIPWHCWSLSWPVL
jgi:hypothetical protein